MSIKNFIRDVSTARNRDNVEEVRIRLFLHLEDGDDIPKWLAEKIRKRSEEYGFKEAQIKAEAVACDMAAVPLAKEASRQKIAEKMQIKYLREIRGIDIEKLPDRGFNSVKLKDGDFVYGALKSELGATKTLDAISNSDYLFIKYVQEAGGGQNHQVDETYHFLHAANEYVSKHDDEYTFTAILDGDYIESKIPELLKLTNDRVRVCTSDTYTDPEEITYKTMTAQ